MSQDPFDRERFLSSKLDEYHVNVPDFPMKRSKWDRFLRFLASPAKNPLEPIITSSDGMLLVKAGPLIAVAVLAIIQVLIFI